MRASGEWKPKARRGGGGGRGDEGAGGVEAEGAAGDQPNLGVDGLDASVGEAVLDRVDDPGALVGDRAGELDEGLEAASSCPTSASRRAARSASAGNR